jgi:DNA-binding CsgD family transcriptional regulator
MSGEEERADLSRSARRSLLERAPHLELIDVVLSQARAGTGQLLWIEGAAGAGKTSLVRAASAAAADQHMTVLRATAEELESDHLLGVVHQLFDPIVRQQPTKTLDELFSGPAQSAREALVEPSPELHADTGTDAASADTVAARLRSGALHHGLYWLLVRLSEEAPVLITVDDLHWIDTTSLSFLGYLARRSADLPIALVIGTRAGVENETSADRARIRAQTNAHHLAPPPLSRAAVASLVRQAQPEATDERCASVFAATGGNPFLVEVAAQIADGSTDLLHDEVRRRLGALTPDVQQLAKAIAVLGADRPLAIAVGVADLAPAAGLDAAAVLRAGEWIEADEPDGRPATAALDLSTRLRFRHPLVRDAVAQLCRPSELDGLHGRAIDVLSAAGADVAEVAMHALSSLPRAVGATVDALVAAADLARRSGADAEAVRLLDRALAEPPPPADRPDILALIARASARAGAADASARFDAAIAAAPDAAARTDLRKRFAAALMATRNPGAAAAVLEAAVDEDDGADIGLTIELQATRLVALRSDPQRRSEWEHNLDELAALDIDGLARTLVPRSPAIRAARAELAYRGGVMGRDLERSRRLALAAVGDEHGTELAFANAQAFATAMHALLQVGEHRLVLDVTSRTMQEAQGAGYGSVFRLASTYQGVALMRLGRAREAIAAAVIDDVMERHLTVFVPINSVTLCQAYLALGLLDDAEKVLEPPGGRERFRNLLTGGGIPEWHGWLRLAQDRPADAAQSFLEIADGTSSLGGANPSTNSWRSGLARAQFLLGDKREAHRISDIELDLARAWGAPRQLGWALTTAGMIRTGASAEALLDDAVAVLETGTDPYVLGWAYLQRGYHRRAGRRRPEAREDFRRALDIGHRHEFALLETAANEALVDAGGRPRARVLSGIDALTPAELRVARAVAEGRSNADVAASLFITRKAVEYHLSNIYRKLQISGRSELAGALTASAR